MILIKTFLLLFIALFVVAAPSATTIEDPKSPDTATLVARGRPSKPPGAPPGGRPPWANKYAGRFGGAHAKAKSQQPQGDSESQSQSQPPPQDDASQSQQQGQQQIKSGGGRGGQGGKGGSSGSDNSQQSQPESQGSEGSSQQQPKQQSNPAPASGGGGGSGYMSIVSKWRGTMGLSALAQDSKLEANAMDTSQSSGGQLKHKLNSGSMGQVMAPGNSGNFESVFVGGWLCEMPSLPGLGSSVCASMTKGWNHAGQVGHAKILSDPKYKKIGCGLASGIWTCDVA